MHRQRRCRLLRAAIILVFVAAVGADAQTRLVKGRVVDADGRALPGAVVQLKNLRTLAIRSFIAKEGGAFQFSGVYSTVDYELRAKMGQRWSDGKIVSQFDSDPVVEVTLTIDMRDR